MEQQAYDKRKKTGGYVALLSVLIIAVVSVSVVIAILLSGVSAANTGLVEQQSRQARVLADACAEEALARVREATSYSGTGGLTLGQGSCTFEVIDNGGENRTIHATGLVDTVVRNVSIEISAINPLVVIDSWDEVADI